MQVTALIPFSPEHVALMKVSDVFETDGVLPGVSEHKTVWKVVTLTKYLDSTKFYLEARYRGIYFGSFSFHKGKLTQEIAG